MTVVKWPIVDDFGIVLSGYNGAAVNVKLDLGELHGDGIMMPFAITNLFERQSHGPRIGKLVSYQISELQVVRENANKRGE